MAVVTSPDLEICLSKEEDCSTVELCDITGVYDATNNPLGYGLPGGPTINNVTSLQISVYWPGFTSPIIYDFSILNGVITAATMTMMDAETVIDIYSQLVSKAWPFIEEVNPFPLSEGFGQIMPVVTDGVIKVVYNIKGVTNSGDSFQFQTDIEDLMDCNTTCCLDNLAAELDPDCACSDDKILALMYGDAFHYAAISAMDLGLSDDANTLIKKSAEMCTTNCKNC